MIAAQRRGELRKRGAVPVEIGPQRNHDQAIRHRPGQRCDECRPLALANGGGEELLELIHDEDPATCAVAVERVELQRGPHDSDRPVLASGDDARPERGHQSRSHGRRLAAPGRADDPHELRPDEVRHHGCDEAFATAEVVGVADVEGRQPLVRTDDGAARLVEIEALPIAGTLELDDVVSELRLGSAKPTPARGRALRRRREAGRGPLRRPLRDGPMDERGNRAGLLEQLLER